MMISYCIMTLRRRNEIGRHHYSSLVKQLIKGMLTVCSWLAPNHRTRCIIDRLARTIGTFSIALHIALLEICRESVQVLIVWQYRFGLCSKEIGIPDTN